MHHLLSLLRAKNDNNLKVRVLCLVAFVFFVQIIVAQTSNDSTSAIDNTKTTVSDKYNSTKDNTVGKIKQLLPKRSKKRKEETANHSLNTNNDSLKNTAATDTTKKISKEKVVSNAKNKLPQLGIKDKLNGAKDNLGLAKDSTASDSTNSLKDNVADKAKGVVPQLGLKDKFNNTKDNLGVSKDSTNNDTTKTSQKLVNTVSESKIAQPVTDRFQSLPVSKDSSLKSNAQNVLKNTIDVPHFDLKEKADLKGKTGSLKNNLISKKQSLVAKTKSTLNPDTLKRKTIALGKKQVKEFNPKGSIAVGYEYGVLPSVIGNFPTGGYRAEGQVGFNALGLPLIATFHYTNIKNVVGLNNYFRISYDANQYKEQLAQKLNVKDQLTQTMLGNLQKQQQQLLQQMDYTNMLNQSIDQNMLNNNLNANGLTNNLNVNGLTNNLGSNYNLNGLTDTAGLMSNITQYANTSQYTNGLNQYSNINDSSALNQANGMTQDNEYWRKKDSIANVMATNKAKYDSINNLITETQQQLDQIKNLQNNATKLDNPYLSKVQNFMSRIKKLEIGLCNPNYSTFLVNNIPLQGINVEFEKNNNFLAITYGTTINNLLFNTNTLQGSLQGARNLYNYFDFGNLSAGRKIICVKGGVGTKEKSHLYLGVMAGKGKADYFLVPGDSTSAALESNLVMELDGKYVFSEQVSVDVVLGKSSVKEDDLTMEQVKKAVNEIFSDYRSNALLTKLNLGIKKTNTKLTLSTRWIDPYFKSFGVGFLRSDNLRYEIKAEQPITKRIKYTVAYRREEDNLLKLFPYKNTLQSINNSLSIRLKKGFNIRLNYVPLFREFRSEDIVITNQNHITTAIVSYAPKLKKIGAQFNVMYSRYIITGDSSNINFENYTYTHQFQFKSGIKTGLSSSWFKDNLKDSLNNDTYLTVADIGYATEKGNSFSVGGKMAYKKSTDLQYGFLAKAAVKLYKGLSFEGEAEKIIIGDYYNQEMIAQIKSFPFYINTRFVYNF